MCNLYNSSIAYQILKTIFFQHYTEAFWDFLRRRKSESLFQYKKY